jgi:hypothetical protein
LKNKNDDGVTAAHTSRQFPRRQAKRGKVEKEKEEAENVNSAVCSQLDGYMLMNHRARHGLGENSLELID